MRIKTTLVMSNEVIDLLDEAEQKTGKDRMMLALRAVGKMITCKENFIRKTGRTEYQKRFDKITGKRIVKRRVKVKMLESEYDYLQDSRKVFRRSISLVVAIAVKLYISDIVDEIMTNKGASEDNYPLANYAIIEKCIENITTFHIWWGIPPDLKQLIQ